MTSNRPLRSDAARNRELLLRAAAEEFAERGLDASVADIARRAGVGKGTVFRHFATKDDLIAAIVLDRVNALNVVGQELLEAADPGAGLLEFLTTAVQKQQQRDLSFLQEADELSSNVVQARSQLFQTIHALVDRAREHRAVRADITGSDVILLMCAPGYVTSYVPDAPPDLWRRYLALIFDGLRPDGASPLPHPPPAAP